MMNADGKQTLAGGSRGHPVPTWPRSAADILISGANNRQASVSCWLIVVIGRPVVTPLFLRLASNIDARWREAGYADSPSNRWVVVRVPLNASVPCTRSGRLSPHQTASAQVSLLVHERLPGLSRQAAWFRNVNPPNVSGPLGAVVTPSWVTILSPFGGK